MDYAQQQRNPAKHVVGIAVVILLHIALVYALVNGLARKVVEVIDEATQLVSADFEKYKPALPKYTPIKDDQLASLAQPYLRGFTDLNETDLKSYQALVDVFIKEGVMNGPMNVHDKLLAKSDLGN